MTPPKELTLSNHQVVLMSVFPTLSYPSVLGTGPTQPHTLNRSGQHVWLSSHCTFYCCLHLMEIRQRAVVTLRHRDTDRGCGVECTCSFYCSGYPWSSLSLCFLLFKASATTKPFLKPVHSGFRCKESVGTLPYKDGVYN